MATLSVRKVPTHVPDLEEVRAVLSDGLKDNFSDVTVTVVDCPDLTQPPFHLAAPGLCGRPRLADVGGPANLLPRVQRDKIYNFKDVAQLVGLPNAFMIGAGAGPAHVIGVNGDLISDVKYAPHGSVTNHSCTATLNTKEGGCKMEQPDSEEFCLMANFLCCDGQPGKVLEVKASRRVGPDEFVTCLRKTLGSYYGDKPVALGGVFLVEKGKVHLHIMPDFSEEPLETVDDVNNWLTFHEMAAPLVTVGELVSRDPGLDLRVEHFHCFSQHGQGGHYHWDTTPTDVAYRAYFVLAESIYRVDQPDVKSFL